MEIESVLASEEIPYDEQCGAIIENADDHDFARCERPKHEDEWHSVKTTWVGPKDTYADVIWREVPAPYKTYKYLCPICGHHRLDTKVNVPGVIPEKIIICKVRNCVGVSEYVGEL